MTKISLLLLLLLCFRGSIKELNNMIVDFIRFKRFKLQLGFLKKIRIYLSKEGFKHRNASIKILAPLIRSISFKKPKPNYSYLICTPNYDQWLSKNINSSFLPECHTYNKIILLYFHGHFDKHYITK